MKNHFTSSILIDGYLYGFHNTIFTCLDFESGDVQWSHRGFNRGSVLSADGKLIIYGARGTLALAAISPEAYEEISSVKNFGVRFITLPWPRASPPRSSALKFSCQI